MRACLPVCVGVCVFVHACVHACVFVHACVRGCVCSCVCARARVCAWVCVLLLADRRRPLLLSQPCGARAASTRMHRCLTTGGIHSSGLGRDAICGTCGRGRTTGPTAADIAGTQSTRCGDGVKRATENMRRQRGQAEHSLSHANMLVSSSASAGGGGGARSPSCSEMQRARCNERDANVRQDAKTQQRGARACNVHRVR